jgi:hypothetical protein
MGVAIVAPNFCAWTQVWASERLAGRHSSFLQLASHDDYVLIDRLSGIVHCLLAPVLIAHEPEHAAKREDREESVS